MKGPPPRYVAGTLFFEPDARRASAPFFEWARDFQAQGGGDVAPQAAVKLCTPEYEGFLEGEEGGRGGEPPRIERFGAAGLYEIACEVAARRAHAADESSAYSPSKKIHLYVTRDVTGAVAAVALEFF